MSDNLAKGEVRNNKGRDVGQIARDLAKGTSLMAVAAALGTADYFLLTNSREIMGPFRDFMPAYVSASLLTAVLTVYTPILAVQGVGTMLGKDPLEWDRDHITYKEK